MKTRFAKFYNLPDLMMMFRECADIQTADMMDLPVPKPEYHIIDLPPSDYQKEMVAALAERAENIRKGMVDPSEDNMLVITNEGRKAALDQRLLNAMLPDNPNSKVNACAENVYRIWNETMENRSAQLIFCDLSTPTKIRLVEQPDGSYAMDENFQDVYNDMKCKLMDKGIPENEIAFIHDCKTDVQKKELFSKVNSGVIRVLMGSTAKMGAGTNCQQKLIAQHDLDCPYRPSDLTQRSGRIIRQGNDNELVHIYRYITTETFDAYMWAMVERKQRFISQVMTSKSISRTMEDVDDVVLSYAELTALATGDPRIIEMSNLEAEVIKLQVLHSGFMNQKYEMQDRIIKQIPQSIQRHTEEAAALKKDQKILQAQAIPPEKEIHPLMIHNQVYKDKKEAGAAILEACKSLDPSKIIEIGSYRGLALLLSWDAFSKEFVLHLQGTSAYSVHLSDDIYGNLTRMNNVISGLPMKIHEAESEVVRLNQELKQLEKEVAVPSPYEADCSEKTERLNQLKLSLNLDKKDPVLDREPDAGEQRKEKQDRDYSR